MFGGSYDKHDAGGGRIRLIRVGGLSPVSQTNKKAPERRGLWAFVYPYVEPFLLGSTDDRGVTRVEGEKERPSRYELMKRGVMRPRVFEYEGYLWTYWDAARHAILSRGDWHLVHSRDYVDVVRRGLAAQQVTGLVGSVAYEVTHLRGRRSYSADHMEVFVPARRGKIVGD